MKIPIDLIRIDEAVRIRKDIGDLKALENSIGAVGLINPVLIDEQNNLVAGYRRIAACRNLGLKEIEVKVIDFSGDRIKMLDVEVAENFFRKDFTPEEILSTERRRQELIEATRKKGLFERFWLWIKGWFSPKESTGGHEGQASRTQPEHSAADRTSPQQGEMSKVDAMGEQDEPDTTAPEETFAPGHADVAESTSVEPVDTADAEEPESGERVEQTVPAEEPESGRDDKSTETGPARPVRTEQVSAKPRIQIRGEPDQSIKWRTN